MTLDLRLARAFLQGHPAEAAQALERLPLDQRVEVVRRALHDAANTFPAMVASSAAECLARLSVEEAAQVVDRLALDAALPLLRRVPEDAALRIVNALAPRKRESVLNVLRYPEGTAASLMDPLIVALPDDIAVGEARVRIRRESHELLHYIFVVDRAGQLIGVIDLAQLMRARPRVPLRSLMRDDVPHLPAWTPAAAVRTHPGWRTVHALPVTDDDGRLLGAIRYTTLRRLEREADTARPSPHAGVTVGALGELFHLGVAGFIEGVVSAAAPAVRSADPAASDRRGVR